ncbi:hypothetical protein S7335_2996 [Synechococcus sp. PCC 7335]|uniref:lipopolysaccharide assembly protein LapA domain-containing protein n=1 Tax=Synechococcus sp. (strain ATCC 29403 / PCC 7335) TaxID=91464 RepID=UPI00017EE064|nr:lipopolysaccharide assembly protein LapA domain-containing protein [Synechococcus sp. PCC 7335]EDX85297.1 hypothetical protein S7335_2996 [Synechococcus sp. PCC 7335]
MVKLLVVVISTVLVISIAILSVQNATLIQLTFLNGQSVPLPIGIWISLALGVGMLGSALLLSLLSRKKSRP